jgi:hypothetical protein
MFRIASMLRFWKNTSMRRSAALGFLAAMLLLAGCGTTRIAKTEAVVGIVIDSKTQRPIPGARVMFLDRKDTITTADSEGEFICGPGYMEVPIKLDFPATFAPDTRIKVSAPGYETRVIQAYPRVEWTQKTQMKRPKVLIVRLESKN